MNQKQRDLLCKMLAKRAEKLKSELGERFFLLNVNKYYFTRDIDSNPKMLDLIIAKQRKLYNKLRKEKRALDEQQDKLRNQMDQLCDELEEEGKKQKKLMNLAVVKLTEAVENSVVKIQFAEGAEDAQAILAGLPSVEDLIG